MVTLSNGCICCSIRDDLLAATRGMLERPNPPEYLIVEASGVSEPVAVALTFISPALRPLVRLDCIIAVVDAEHAGTANFTDGMADLMQDQAAVADIVVINKIDLVDEVRRAQARAWVRMVARRARILEAVAGQVPLDLVLGAKRQHIAFGPITDGAGHNHDHADMFATWSYETTQPLSYDKVRHAFKSLPLSVFRAKGILALADAPAHRTVAQVVGKRISLTVGRPWGAERPSTQLVFVGTPGGRTGEELTTLFDRCMAGGVGRRAARDLLAAGMRIRRGDHEGRWGTEVMR